MEKNGATVTEQNIKTICSQFSVNENWLRTDSGKCFLKTKNKKNFSVYLMSFFLLYKNI